MRLHPTFRRVAAATAVLALAATAACSTSSKDDDPQVSSKELKVTVVLGPLSDPFFSAIKAGTEQAGKDLDVKVDYTAPQDLSNLAADITRLTKAAISAKPDAIVTGNYLPDAQEPLLKQIVSDKIPLVLVHAGPDWRSLGAITYVGEEALYVGEQAGGRFTDAGAKNVLCVVHVPGNPTLADRCKGVEQTVKAAGGKAKTLTIPADQSTNPTSVTNAISGALRNDPEIDAVMTLGSGIAESAVRATDSAKSKAIIGTTDLSKNVLDDIKSGSIEFAVDQQPFLQGYYGVLAAVQHVRLGLAPSDEVKTSPNFVTKDNVDDVIRFNDENDGVRGAA